MRDLPTTTPGASRRAPSPAHTPPPETEHIRLDCRGLRGADAADAAPVSEEVDLRGLGAPAALQRLGDALTARGSARFVADPGPLSGALYAWAGAMGAHVAQLEVSCGVTRGRVDMAGARAAPSAPAQLAPTATPPRHDLCTLLVLHDDFESLMAALLVANASAAQGMKVMIFFSFWAVNLLRGDTTRALPEVPAVRGSLLQSVMKWMMPRGPDRLRMGRMHMGGLGMALMRRFMKRQNVLGLKELLAEAAAQDVRFCVCTMSMGLMGIAKGDLLPLPNLEYGGVTTFSERARRSATSLVF